MRRPIQKSLIFQNKNAVNEMIGFVQNNLK